MQIRNSGGEKPPLSNYSKAQKQAILHKSGPCIVLAGPGSGKTTVITGRLQNMLKQDRIDPNQILVITFTKYAAREMKDRFRKMGIAGASAVTFGTFHGIYYGMLKQVYRLEAGQILSEDEQKVITEAAVQDVERANHGKVTDKDVLLMIGKVKNNGGFQGITNDPEDRAIYRAYEKRKKAAGKIDFDDMLLLIFQVFREKPEILKKWQERYRYILIDEFQDCSRIQYESIKLLAGNRKNLFVVGDDDQSIYGFRGASPSIMKQFSKDYPEAKVICLDINYRSTGHIVSASGKVIAHNRNRFPKKIHTMNSKGKPVHVQELADMSEEADYVALQVKRKLEQGIRPEEIAVIFRTTQDASMTMSSFMNYNIPFFMKEKAFHLYEHFIAEDMKAYFRIAQGNRQRSDFLRIINRPNRYVSRNALEKEKTDFEDIRKFYCDKDWMLDRIDQMEEDMAEIGRMTPYAAFQYIRKKIGYQEFLWEYAQKQQIEKNELENIMDEIAESMKRKETLQEWIEYTDIYTNHLKELEKGETFTKEKVAFLTMHGAKGLEYRFVYVIEAEEGILPHRKAIRDGETEEERRLFYVAMTRAKEELVITYVKQKNGKDVSPSRFVQELFIPHHPQGVH